MPDLISMMAKAELDEPERWRTAAAELDRAESRIRGKCSSRHSNYFVLSVAQITVPFHMINPATVRLIFVALLFTYAESSPAAFLASNQINSDSLLENLWQGTASFKQVLRLQIQSNGPIARSVAGPSLMDSGTQIVAMSNFVPTSKTWYLFNREFFYGGIQPANCPSTFALSRIVVRSSQDRGHTWSPETVVAEPNVANGECELVDGHAFYDPDTNTWHYISQMWTGLTSSVGAPQSWHINHYALAGQSPMLRFAPDSANPVVKSGQLWSKICGPRRSCPNGTDQEGTPEISFKKNGYFYITFHGAFATSPVWGYRGIAKTADFHKWLTHEDDPADSYLPNDALWSKQDCAGWKVSWNAATGCVGGGHASSLITPAYTYMLIESTDVSLGCTAGQNWVIGLVRAPNLSATGKSQRFVASGHWQQYGQNPLINAHNNYPCSIQYQRFFVDGLQLYLTYWTIETIGSTPSGLPNNRTSFFHVAHLNSDAK
jgi:hypothetical protein